MSSKEKDVYSFELKDLFRIIKDYKFFIIFVSLLSLFLSSVYLYFKPSIYSSYSIIEVKTRDKNIKVTDDLLQNAFYSTNKAIEKEMEILRTYKANKDVIEKINFRIQYFIKNNYKKDELYDNLPIEITNLKVLDNNIIGKDIQVILEDNGFRLKVITPKKDEILSKIFHKEDKLLKLDSTKVYPYNKEVKIEKYLKLSLKKTKYTVNQPIYFRVNGDTRNIYESIVRNRLQVSQLNKDAPLIKISYEDTIPDRAVNYVNNLVTTFLESEKETKYKKSDKILKFLKNQLKNTKEKLLRSERELEQYKVSNNIINPSVQSNVMIQKLSEIEISISDSVFRKMLLDETLEIIKSRSNYNALNSYLANLGENGLLGQLNTLHKLELQKIDLSSEFTDEYPKLQDINKQIASIKRNILLSVKNLRKSVIYKIANLRKMKRKYENSLLDLPKKEIALTNLLRKHEVNSQMYEYLLKKKSEKEIIKVATSSDYKIIEKAYISKIPIKPKRSLIMLLSLVLGFLVGVFLAVIFHRGSKNLKNIDDIEILTSLPIYTKIPALRKKKGYKIEVFETPESTFTDSFRKLRTNLQLLSKDGIQSKVILVTSLINGEGKSLSVSNLSAILQLAGYKVIVIDLNLHNPTLHKYFDIDFDGGVADYLSGKENMSDIIFSTAHPNLDIIPSGYVPINPSELVLSKRVETMFKKLRERYDYILVDSPSLLSYTDTLHLMKYSDFNLVVINPSFVKKSHLTELNKMINKYKLTNIGLVLNKISLKYLYNMNIK